MCIIEFAGMPRSGKTTIVKALCQRLNNANLYPERFDLVPYKKEDGFEYNFWYAKYCIKRLNKIVSHKGTHLFDRGIIDRIAFGNALASYGKFTKTQLEKYLVLLEPYIDYEDLVFIINISPEVSLINAKSGKKNITRDLEFLKYLHSSYSNLRTIYKNLFYLPPNLGSEELTEVAFKKIISIKKPTH